MTNTHDIVIPRSELPKTLTTINTTGTFVHPAASASMWSISKESSSTVRKRAMDYLAVAEQIDAYLAEAKAKEEEAIRRADAEKLAEEAQALSRAAGGYVLLTAAQPWEVEYWKNLARAARELHGK